MTSAAKPGANQIEIQATHPWVNWLIGVPRRLPAAVPAYRADAPLPPSGLLGPVMLIGVRERR